LTQSSTASWNWRLIAAFAAVYIIWGSTYLAIRFAIATLPPFLMAGVRFLFAGSVLYSVMLRRGVPAPTRIHWRSTIIIGALLLLAGNGGVTWAEQRIPSSLAALLVAIVPLWIVLLNWMRPGGVRPGGLVLLGVMVGFIGIVLLVNPIDLLSGSTKTQLDPLGLIAILIASFCWAVGSLYSRRAPLPDAPLMTTGMEMIAGGSLLLIVGTFSGEWKDFHPDQISLSSVLAVIYLVVFGAIIAYSAYTWLLKETTPARASTYAYVNPVVAVFLGWALGGEVLTPRTLVAAAVIIGAVILITSHREIKPVLPRIETAAALPGEA
jgi:drug/metabolite transporter (DMT)-like permease